MRPILSSRRSNKTGSSDSFDLFKVTVKLLPRSCNENLEEDFYINGGTSRTKVSGEEVPNRCSERVRKIGFQTAIKTIAGVSIFLSRGVKSLLKKKNIARR